MVSHDRVRFQVGRFRDQLWVRPMLVCLMSISGVLIAKLADRTPLADLAPEISHDSLGLLLSIMASSMLVIATFAVGSMVSAYSSAASSVTPRSLALVMADDLAQNALSTFIAAFIFSIVALTALNNGFYAAAGVFTLFTMTAIVFGIVIVTFVRWVDRIARLGRLSTCINQIEQATSIAMSRRRHAQTLGGIALQPGAEGGMAVFSAAVGYVLHVDVAALQGCAARLNGHVVVAALPGTFAAPGKPLAYLQIPSGQPAEADSLQIAHAFVIGEERLFDDDPRFGLVVLSEIAGRALPPAANDPGTAINIIGTVVRLFALWARPLETPVSGPVKYDRVSVPQLSVADMFDDAFTSIGRDGAGLVEVALRLQKALHSLTLLNDDAMREAAMHHSRVALGRCERRMDSAEDLAIIHAAARFSESLEAEQTEAQITAH